jgi:glycosyltransferase involved in cell wall biosynthesis
MRLLFYIYSLGAGGAERVTVNLAGHWVNKGWQVGIATVEPVSIDFYDLDPRIERFHLGGRHSLGPLAAIDRIWQLRTLLKELRPDAAIAMMSTANVALALAAAGLCKIETLGSERIHPPELPIAVHWHFLRRHTYGYHKSIVALSSEGAAWVRDHTNAKQVDVIPNPIVLPLVRQEPIILPGLHIKSGEKLMLAVGRLAPQKGFDALLTAFARLADGAPEWRLAILGEGPSRHELVAQADALGIGPKVAFPGRVGNVADWYEKADLFVLTSHFEGFPNALAEAMAHGVPAVSFDCETGPRDIIRHMQDGILVPPRDQAGLLAALKMLTEDAALRARFGALAADVGNRLSPVKVVAAWERALGVPLT